jgi:hypothetical protein
MEISTRTLWSGERDVRGRFTARPRLHCAATQVWACLAPALATRQATVPPESMPPVQSAQILKLEIATRTLRSGGRAVRVWFTARSRLFCDAGLVRVYLPPALEARLPTVPPEFMPPVHASKTLKMEIATKTLRSGGTGRAGAVRGEASAVLCRRAGPGVSAVCVGNAVGDDAGRIHAAGAHRENPQNGNRDKDPMKRGTGRAGARLPALRGGQRLPGHGRSSGRCWRRVGGRESQNATKTL